MARKSHDCKICNNKSYIYYYMNAEVCDRVLSFKRMDFDEFMSAWFPALFASCHHWPTPVGRLAHKCNVNFYLYNSDITVLQIIWRHLSIVPNLDGELKFRLNQFG